MISILLTWAFIHRGPILHLTIQLTISRCRKLSTVVKIAIDISFDDDTYVPQLKFVCIEFSQLIIPLKMVAITF